VKLKTLLARAAMLMATVAASAAPATTKPQTLLGASYWEAWYSASNSKGRPMCGMSSQMDGRYLASFMVKFPPPPATRSSSRFSKLAGGYRTAPARRSRYSSTALRRLRRTLWAR
jgi:hypothetical protein